MQTRVSGARLPVMPGSRKAQLHEPVNASPPRFRGVEESHPLSFLDKLPDDGPAPQAAKFRARAKALLFLEPALWRSNFSDRIRLADSRAPLKQWARGNLVTGLKLFRNQLAAVKPTDHGALAAAYLELGSTCLNLHHDKQWAVKVTEAEFASRDFGAGAVAAVYPRPVHLRTEAYFRALKNSGIDFAKLGKQLYETGMQHLEKTVPDPNRPEIDYIRKAQCHQRFGETDKAISVLKEGLAKLNRPEQKTRMQRHLADLARQTGRYMMALFYYEELKGDYLEQNAGKKKKLEEDTYLGVLHHEIATMHFELGHLEKAIEQAKEACRHSPKGTVFYGSHQYGSTFEQFLGKLLVLKERNAASGEKLAR